MFCGAEPPSVSFVMPAEIGKFRNSSPKAPGFDPFPNELKPKATLQLKVK